MFDLILNAVKVATSKEVRESAGALVAALKKSPEWQHDICTVEGRVSVRERERLHLIRDLVMGKLDDLSYPTDVRRRFAFVFQELTQNAIEHGAASSLDAVLKMILDVSPSYVSLSVHNPKEKSVDIQSWLQQSKDQLVETKKLGRGRGLILTYRKADRLEQDGDAGIKATFFRDNVVFKILDIEDTTVVVVISGHSNPSLGRRLQEQLDFVDADKLILCLHLRYLRLEKDRPRIEAEKIDLLYELAREIDEDFPAPEIGCDLDTKQTFQSLRHLNEWAEMRGKLPSASVRLVCGDPDIQDLLPRDVVSRSVADAIAALKVT